VNLLVVVVLVEFGHEVQQALAVATENLKHLSAVESVQTNTRHDMFKNAVICAERKLAFQVSCGGSAT
jgi:hypothetical protein